jgi:hypothetical protein
MRCASSGRVPRVFRTRRTSPAGILSAFAPPLFRAGDLAVARFPPSC